MQKKGILKMEKNSCKKGIKERTWEQHEEEKKKKGKWRNI